MADETPHYQINEPIRGIRFYVSTNVISTTADFSIQTAVTAAAGFILASPGANIDITSNLSASSNKVITASSSISAGSTSVSGSIEILNVLSYISISSQLTGKAKNYKKSVALLDVDSSVESSPITIKSDGAQLSSSASVSASAIRFRKAYSALTSLMSINISDPSKFATIEKDISLSSNVLISDVVIFTPNSRYPGSLLNMISINGVSLTAQGRTFSESVEQIFVEQKNWNNSKSRYYKRQTAGKTRFSLSWKFLPSKRESTIDLREARNFIEKLAMDPDIHHLKILSYGENPEDLFNETSYNVFVSSYSESLLRRDLVSGEYFWDCSLELEEA